MKIGYARISTHDQNLNLQIDALDKAGCENIFTDTASGSRDDRQGLKEAIACCREGDSLIVWKLGRLGRSLKHLIDTINRLHTGKVGFVSLQESIDTQIPGGKLVFHVFGAPEMPENQILIWKSPPHTLPFLRWNRIQPGFSTNFAAHLLRRFLLLLE